MDIVNKQYGPPAKMTEKKLLESYFKRRMKVEGYGHRKHNFYGFQSNRPQIIGILVHELDILL